jgi:uncharacterized membrane protein YagU involved in acid resistance
MVVAMTAARELAPSARWHALPPRQVVRGLAQRVGIARRRSPFERYAATAAGHFGYGGAAGALYPYASRVLPGPTLVRGALFGVGLWAAGYLGWVPATGILPPATRETAGRNAMNIAAHVVWGVATAVVAKRLIERSVNGEVVEVDAETDGDA